MVKFKKETKKYDTIEVIKSETNNKINESQIEINRAKPGYRSDNNWHLYDPKFLSNILEKSEQDNKKWENTKFLDKSYWGYYCWPSKIEINLNKRKTFTTDTNEFSEAVKPIEMRFRNDPEFVKKFIKLATIEEAKGQERFDKKKFHLFKALFRNYGSVSIINNLYDHLTMLVTDKQIQTHECSHKLAAELISGLIRGSKYWPLDDLKQMWTKLKVILDLVIENISTENIKLWLICFSTSFVSIYFFY
jgi:proteasome activator subunit 4